MNILFSAGYFPTKNHPFASFIADMAKGMVEYGHSVTIIAPQSITRTLFKKSLHLPEYEEAIVPGQNNKEKPIKIYRPKVLTFGNRGIFGKLTFWIRKKACERKLRHHNSKYDLAYAHFWENAYNISSVVTNENLPLVVVSGEDKIELHNILNKKQIHNLSLLTKKTICVSNKNRSESISSGLCDANNSIVIPNGADSRKFFPINKDQARKKLNINSEDFIVAFVGRFIERKGQMRVIAAMDKLADPQIKGIFIGKSLGDPTQEPSGDKVVFKGIISHEDIHMYLSASDIFVLPTLAEGCSNSIAEAMACGLPIISSDLPFNYDILNSLNSILVNPNNISEIAEAIKYLKDNPILREKMSEESLKIASNLCFENKLKKIMKILSELDKH